MPESEEELSVLISEVIGDILEFAQAVSTSWEKDTVTITLHGYRFIDGCLFSRSVSPHCCTRYPCPACSLCGTLLAEGTSKIVTLEQCSVSTPQDISAVFRLISSKTE
jgi:hypothetical protein